MYFRKLLRYQQYRIEFTNIFCVHVNYAKKGKCKKETLKK